jgi:hypothetical protein
VLLPTWEPAGQTFCVSFIHTPVVSIVTSARLLRHTHQRREASFLFSDCRNRGLLITASHRNKMFTHFQRSNDASPTST